MMHDLFQEAIQARCFHPSGNWVEFKREEVEQSIPDRFEKIVRKYPDRVAVKTATHTLTYAELNAMRHPRSSTSSSRLLRPGTFKIDLNGASL